MLLARAPKKFIPNMIFSRNHQVTVLGAATEVGQKISLLLRTQPCISRLVIHDSQDHMPGVLLDISHIPADSTVIGYTGDHTLDDALKGSEIVIVTGGATEKPGLTKENCFSLNTAFIRNAAAKIARTIPLPFVGIVTEPINSTVPMAAEIMRNHGDYDGRKLFGITAVDFLRTQCLYAIEHNLSPCACTIPVIGGHSPTTTIPLLSQAKPYFQMDEKSVLEFTANVRKCDYLITRAKKGFAPTLSVAYGALVFVRAILNVLEGYPNKVNAYVENNDFGTCYFSGLVSVNQTGAAEMQRYDGLSGYECHLLENTIDQLRKDISQGKKVLEWA